MDSSKHTTSIRDSLSLLTVVETAVDVEAELQERKDGREMEVEDKGGRSVLDTGVPLYILIIHEPFAQGILCCLTSRAHELVGRVRSYADVVGL